MPIFEYDCPQRHRVERIRKYAARDEPVTCPQCAAPMTRVEISRTHCPPDGVYSYMPNIGDPNAFERRREALKNGQRIIKKELPAEE